MPKTLIKKLLFFSLTCALSFLLISSFSPKRGVKVPILMYHHFDENVASDMIVSPETFDMHMRTLHEAGYTAITFDELVDYVENGTPLPKNPICITMDDGYLSNYTYAYPTLQKYGMKATVFVIGSTAGSTYYRDTEYPIIPYFDWDKASEMLSSGVMDIQCHTYDLHHWAPYEIGDRPIRENVLPLKGESQSEYKQVLTADFNTFIELSQTKLGKTPTVMAYPNGKYTAESEEILHSLGFKVTLTTNSRTNYIFKDDEKTLFLLGRYTITDDISAKELLDIIK